MPATLAPSSAQTSMSLLSSPNMNPNLESQVFANGLLLSARCFDNYHPIFSILTASVMLVARCYNAFQFHRILVCALTNLND
jgi:hypothetical protein